jgi:pyridoxal 5'-phosphate synthase pdxS subunit
MMAVASVERIFTGGDNKAVGVADSQDQQQQQQQQAKGTFTVKAGLAQMLKGGIIMDVVNAQQARIAEEAGACAVMALEKVPADIRRDGGVARMADPRVSRSLYFIMDCNSLMTTLE